MFPGSAAGLAHSEERLTAEREVVSSIPGVGIGSFAISERDCFRKSRYLVSSFM